MTKKPTSTDIRQLLTQLVLPFYQIDRDLPLPIPGRRNETDGEHSWSLALLACSLAPLLDASLDVGKVCQFAIVHDLTELHAGDTSIFAAAEHLQSKEAREHKALQTIQQQFRHFPWLVDSLAEYEQQLAPEARFVRAVDKVIALWFDYLDQGQYHRERAFTKDHFIEHTATHRRKAAAHPTVLEYYDRIHQLILDTPDFFHKV